MESKQKSKRFNYSQDSLEKAVEEVRKVGGLNKIAKKYGIPKATLSKKIRGIVPLERKMGPTTILDQEEEERICKYILDKAKLGFPLHSEEIQNSVQKVIKETNRNTPFTDGRPGKKWLQLYLRRHLEIVKKNAEIISKARAEVSEHNIRQWFFELRSFLQENSYQEVMLDASRIFNADETGMQFCPKSGKLLGPRAYKNFYEISSGPEKENITVLCNYSAIGKAVPAMVVLPYKRIPRDVAFSIPDGFYVGRSDSGWMTTETFFEYICNCFYPWLLDNNVTFPIMLFLDGHKSHISIELANFCTDKKIIIYCLYPNSTHILQPCDVGIFKPLKAAWKKEVHHYKQTTNKYITKATFMLLFKKAFEEATSEDTIRNAFKACGLFPLDEEAVNYEKCISYRKKQLLENNVVFPQQCLEQKHFATVLEVMKLYDADLFQEFREMERSNTESHDSLYNFFKFCSERVDSEKNQEILTESYLDNLPIQFDDVVIDKTDYILETLSVPEENKTDFNFAPNRTDNETDFTKESSVFYGANIEDHEGTSGVYTEEFETFRDYDIPTTSFENTQRENKVIKKKPEENNTDLNSVCTDKVNSAPEGSENETEISKENSAFCEANIEDQNGTSVVNSAEFESFRNCDIPTTSFENMQKEIETTTKKNEENETDLNCKVNSSSNGSKNKIESLEKNNNTKNKNLKKINIISSITIKKPSTIWDKYLAWPKQTYNNKKKKEKLPYAITSKKWQEYYLQKDKLKKEKARQMEERKKEREKKRLIQNEKNKRPQNKRIKTSLDNQDNENSYSNNVTTSSTYQLGDYVLAVYEKNIYPGRITGIDNYGEYQINVMEQTAKQNWKWPSRPDQLWYKASDVLKKINPPQPLNTRGIFKVPETMIH